jgi:hypothetical protein
MKKTRKPQTPKVGNRAMAQAFQELRRSSAASPHRNKAKYTRKTKHKGMEF